MADAANAKLTTENFMSAYLEFQDRQAGVGVIYNAEKDLFTYNAYCMDRTVLKEIFSCEYAILDEALACINGEFETWELKTFEKKDSGCSSCIAKKP